jgi:hypothetical protein
MNVVGRTFSVVVFGILTSLAGQGAFAAPTDHRTVGAAVHPANGGGQGITGRPQKNGTMAGSPKANSNISGSQIRGKH